MVRALEARRKYTGPVTLASKSTPEDLGTRPLYLPKLVGSGDRAGGDFPARQASSTSWIWSCWSWDGMDATLGAVHGVGGDQRLRRRGLGDGGLKSQAGKRRIRSHRRKMERLSSLQR